MPGFDPYGITLLVVHFLDLALQAVALYLVFRPPGPTPAGAGDPEHCPVAQDRLAINQSALLLAHLEVIESTTLLDLQKASEHLRAVETGQRPGSTGHHMSHQRRHHICLDMGRMITCHTCIALLDATTVLSRSIAELGIYPAVNPLDSKSCMLDPRIVGREYYRVATAF